mmetsp:Transcript_23528/g.48092  ORF Transcript_23528/g.48092 Transcript_23528/m.48092 type:complete len:176 (+) Transcript_23528:275-802(+)
MAFGEPLVAGSAGVGPNYVDSLCPLLTSLLCDEECHPNLLSNAATTLGRLSLVSPSLVAPHAPGFARHWLLALQEVGSAEERDQAFKGLATLSQHAWEALVATPFHEFLCALASWSFYDFELADELKAAFQHILSSAAQQMPPPASSGGDGGMRAYLGGVEENYREYLTQTYALA